MQRIFPNALKQALNRQLPSVFIITGDEPLQITESLDCLRAIYKQKGFEERYQYPLPNQKSIPWDQISDCAEALSLFSSGKLFELKIPDGLSKQAQASLEKLKASGFDGVALVLLVEKETAKLKNNKIYKSLQSQAFVVPCYNMKDGQLINWLNHRAQMAGITLSADACASIGYFTQGNMLSAAQIVEQASLLYPEQQVTLDKIDALVHDASRFDVFGLTESICTRQATQSTRILKNLKQTDVSPILILATLAREARLLFHIKCDLDNGTAFNQIGKKYHLWEKRLAQVKKALFTQPEVNWKTVLLLISILDSRIKSQKEPQVWEILEQIALTMQGNAVPSALE